MTCMQFEPVEWIRKRTVILSKANKLNLPVRVRPHAIADGRPSRNLYMAPGHAMLYEGKLYRIGDLVNGGSILPEPHWKSVTYWGIKLRRHNAIYAEGMLVETLLPDNEILFAEASPQSDAEGRTAEDAAAKAWDIAAEIKDVLLMARPTLARQGG